MHTGSSGIAHPERAGKAARQRADKAWRLGVQYAKRGQHHEAVCQFGIACKEAPAESLYWINLSSSQQKLALHEPARQSARQAFDLDRGNIMVCRMLAEMLRAQNQPEESLQVLGQLDAATARDVEWHRLQGQALHKLRRAEEAILSFLNAISAPDCTAKQRVLIMMEMGLVLLSQQLYTEAATCFRTVLDIDSRSLGAALYAAHCSAWACDWPDQELDLQRLSACIGLLRDDPAQERLMLSGINPFCLITLTDDPALLRWAAELAIRFEPVPIAPADQRPALARPAGKIRIGLLSADFHHHATSMLLVETLESIRKDQFELILYSTGPDDQSPLRKRILNCADRFHEISALSDQSTAELIRSEQIAVLIDLKGFTQNSRMRILAQRPAPIQVAWLGYPGSCGASYIDYIIGDPTVTPIEDQDFYTESIAQMPCCYQPNDSTRPLPPSAARQEHQLPEDAFVLCSFNREYKNSQFMFEIWCDLLRSIPNSVLWLIADHKPAKQNLLNFAIRQGIAPDRIIFAENLPIESHRSRLPCADLFLDTYPCGGHTTASDALWAGVPVLTLAGASFPSRVAASLLTTLGLPELICHDAQSYRDRAIALGTNPEMAQALRTKLAHARDHTPTFDGRRFAADLEQLLLRMVERHEAGLPPAPLPAAGSPPH